ncbi:MAG: hypothetical protein FWH15_02960 [Betaproteobacteria bacterium]|nr:hypothetical protein [Betaproteobacteria bacterium]
MLGLMVFGTITLWMALSCLMMTYLFMRIWRGIRNKQGTGWHVKTAVFGFFVLAWLTGSFWYSGGRNYYYDAEVNRLCNIDGGIKVYEIVTLPPEKFNEWGQVNFYEPTQGENALGSEYSYKWEQTYLKKGNPKLYQYHIEVVRRVDSKKLGETTLYSRVGGNLPFMGSNYRCPPLSESGEGMLFKRIFINSTTQKE